MQGMPFALPERGGTHILTGRAVILSIMQTTRRGGLFALWKHLPVFSSVCAANRRPPVKAASKARGGL